VQLCSDIYMYCSLHHFQSLNGRSNAINTPHLIEAITIIKSTQINCSCRFVRSWSIALLIMY
jgi:hypothetical protein